MGIFRFIYLNIYIAYITGILKMRRFKNACMYLLKTMIIIIYCRFKLPNLQYKSLNKNLRKVAACFLKYNLSDYFE